MRIIDAVSMRSHRESPSKSRAGLHKAAFTLIELLTVVAILAILMAMLFPSLHMARRKAKTLACVVNMKQQNMCYMAYTEDYNRQFPRSHTTETPTYNIGGQAATWEESGGTTYYLMLNSYAGVDESYVDENNWWSRHTNGSMYASKQSLCPPYIMSEEGYGSGDGRQIFNCPGDIDATHGQLLAYWGKQQDWTDGTGEFAGDGPKSTNWWGRFGSRSYVYNSLGNSRGDTTRPYGLQYIQMQEVADPSYTVMSNCLTASGGMDKCFGNNNQAPMAPYLYTYWHSGEPSEGPALFVDGSVRIIRLYNNFGATHPEPQLYGHVANDPARYADFNFCFIEFPGLENYDWKHHNNGY